jgi:hypothetical protein
MAVFSIPSETISIGGLQFKKYNALTPSEIVSIQEIESTLNEKALRLMLEAADGFAEYGGVPKEESLDFIERLAKGQIAEEEIPLAIKFRYFSYSQPAEKSNSRDIEIWTYFISRRLNTQHVLDNLEDFSAAFGVEFDGRWTAEHTLALGALLIDINTFFQCEANRGKNPEENPEETPEASDETEGKQIRSEPETIG